MSLRCNKCDYTTASDSTDALPNNWIMTMAGDFLCPTCAKAWMKAGRTINIGKGPLKNEPPPPEPEELSRRDRFAAAALTGLCANQKTTGLGQAERISQMAYEFADWMLKKRKGLR